MRLIHIGIIAVITSLIGCGNGDVSVQPSHVISNTTQLNNQLPKNSVATIHDGLIRIVAYSVPDDSGKIVSTFPSKNRYGSLATFLVITREGDWIKVSLPIRPNGSTAWIKASDITLAQATSSIKIDLLAHSMVIINNGKTTVHKVGIGSEKYPTPVGKFFVTDRLKIPGGGPYGNFALGLSARSNTLTEFNGGDAQIGIHGTDKPSSVGKSESHGCIRAYNDIPTMQILEKIGLGTPVIIVK